MDQQFVVRLRHLQCQQVSIVAVDRFVVKVTSQMCLGLIFACDDTFGGCVEGAGGCRRSCWTMGTFVGPVGAHRCKSGFALCSTTRANTSVHSML